MIYHFLQESFLPRLHSLSSIPQFEPPRTNIFGWSNGLPNLEDLLPRSVSSRSDFFEKFACDDDDYVEPNIDSIVGSAPRPDDDDDDDNDLDEDDLDLASIERSVFEDENDQVVIDIGTSSNSESESAEAGSDEYAIPLVAYEAYNPDEFEDDDICDDNLVYESEETETEESSYYASDESDGEEEFSIGESEEEGDEDFKLATEEFYNDQVAIRIESTSEESASSPERSFETGTGNENFGGIKSAELFRLTERKTNLFDLPMLHKKRPNGNASR